MISPRKSPALLSVWNSIILKRVKPISCVNGWNINSSRCPFLTMILCFMIWRNLDGPMSYRSVIHSSAYL